jgi:hypothetical protein
MAEERRARRRQAGPIPLDPVDLLAGLAPGVILHADEVPPDPDRPVGEDDAVTTVTEVGKLLRSGDDTIRRLIRTAGIEPREPHPADDDPPEPERAGTVPKTRTRPGE